MGGGVVRRPENSLDNAFFLLFLSVLNLFYSLQSGSNGFITEKTILFKGSRGSNFSGGGSRVQVLISIETHITCDFPWGGPHRRITLPHYICKLPGRVKPGKFVHYLQIVLIQMRRLLMSHIRSFTICLGNLFLFQYLKYETNKVAVRN